MALLHLLVLNDMFDLKKKNDDLLILYMTELHDTCILILEIMHTFSNY